MNSFIPRRQQLLADLVASASISSVSPEFDMGNLQITQLLANWCESAGFSCELIELETHNPKANLVAKLGNGNGGLVLSGHTDTVPFDEGRWDSDPFTLTNKEDRLCGLGIADMKCFFAFALEAVSRFNVSDFKRPLYFVGTADEESRMTGGRSLADGVSIDANFAIIGEPTNMRPVRRHKGIFMDLVRVIGKSGHSSDPALGHNALEGAALVIDELMRVREELRQAYNNPDFSVTYPTLNLGHIHGGDNPNRICGEVELHFDCRTLPGMGIVEIRAHIQDRIRKKMASEPFSVEFKTLFEGVDALETRSDSPIITAAESASGNSAGSVAFCTEGPFYNAMGIETVIIGPGDINQAHQPNESIALENVDRYVDLLEALIHRFCIAEAQA